MEQQTVVPEVFELKLEILNPHEYMPRINEVNLPCQWLHHCYNGKCQAFRKIGGNFYCARRVSH